MISEPIKDALSLNPDASLAEDDEFGPAGSADAGGQHKSVETKEPILAEDEGSEKRGGKKRIGEQLVEAGIITAHQLRVALHEKERKGRMLGETLVDLGFINANYLSAFLSETSGVDTFDPKSHMIDPDAVKKIPKDVAKRFQILPISFDDKRVNVAMVDPYDVVALDKIRRYFSPEINVRALLCTPTELSDAIDNVFGHAVSIEGILQELSSGQPDLTNITEEETYSHPLVRLVNAFVLDAVKAGASDLHFEPEEHFVRLRFRIDGVLHEVQNFHKDYWDAIAQRLKILSEMNIADKLNPQDGRFGLTVGGREVDFRVSSLPTAYGENFVLRVLDKSTGIMPMEGLGFSERNLRIIKRVQARPEGIIIVTGPTGSGKTTSLYSMLNSINTMDVNIMTLEDPIEYNLPLIRQSQVREGAKLTFANGVKALLRQDPDIIFIGEIRDHDTATMALKAAMTGHQVYTTLHTNDSFGAIPRLLDLGLKPGMIAGAVIASFAQRLVRRVCDYCHEDYVASPEE